MRIRKLALVTAAATLPFGLTACGGASVDDFCEQFGSIDQTAEEDADRAKGELEELADVVPEEAGDEVRDAVDLLAEKFPADGDLQGALASGDLTEEFVTAAQTVESYGTENCAE